MIPSMADCSILSWRWEMEEKLVFQAFSPTKNFFKKLSTLLLTVLTNGAKIQSNKGKVLKEKGTLVPASEKRIAHPRSSLTVLIQNMNCLL